jgi:hypothetical protein
MDHPKTLTTWSHKTQDEYQQHHINIRENWRRNQEWTIQRHWQFICHVSCGTIGFCIVHSWLPLQFSENFSLIFICVVSCGSIGLWIGHSWLSLQFSLVTNKRERKLKEQSRMANPEILATWSHKTQDEYQQHQINVRENWRGNQYE